MFYRENFPIKGVGVTSDFLFTKSYQYIGKCDKQKNLRLSKDLNLGSRQTKLHK